jgi:hypothetical protein
MNTAIELCDIISIGDLHNKIVDVVLQAFINIGGNAEDVRRFMDTSEAASARRSELLRTLAEKATNGPLWEIAGERVRIGNIDYRSAMFEFVKEYDLATHIDVPPDQQKDTWMSGDFTYCLRHEDRYETLWKIAHDYSNHGIHVADWRELVAYGSLLQSKGIDLKGYEIFAFGSSFRFQLEVLSYPYLRMERGKIALFWTSLAFRNAASRRRLYLMRHLSTAPAQ